MTDEQREILDALCSLGRALSQFECTSPGRPKLCACAHCQIRRAASRLHHVTETALIGDEETLTRPAPGDSLT